MKTLVGHDLLEPKLDAMVKRVNQDKFLAVQVPGADHQVLLTPAGELDNGNFLDPARKQQLIISHAEQKCVGAEPLTAEQLASTEGAEELRSSVDGAMRSYAAEKLPGAVVTTYGHKSGGACKVRPGRRV